MSWYWAWRLEWINIYIYIYICVNKGYGYHVWVPKDSVESSRILLDWALHLESIWKSMISQWWKVNRLLIRWPVEVCRIWMPRCDASGLAVTGCDSPSCSVTTFVQRKSVLNLAGVPDWCCLKPEKYVRRVLLAACMHVREDGIVGKVAALDKVFAQMDPITDTMQHTVRLLLDREVQQFQTCWVLMGGLMGGAFAET